jgi:hypothetical protein
VPQGPPSKSNGSQKLNCWSLTGSQDGGHLTPTAWSSLHILTMNWLTSESESALLYEWRFTANQFVLKTSPLRFTNSNFIFQMNTCSYSPYVTSSLTRGWVCRLQLLLVLVRAVILKSKSCGTHDHISLSQIRESPKLEGQVPVFVSRWEEVIPVIRPGTGFDQAPNLASLITSQYGPTENHVSDNTSILAYVFFSGRICLPTRCPETALVYPSI